MSTVDRIEALRSEAADAVARAAGSDALEELRVRYLGRKAELPNLLVSADLDVRLGEFWAAGATSVQVTTTVSGQPAGTTRTFAKPTSGAGGGIVTVAPGKGGLGTFAPPLDAAGNSVKGQPAAKFLSAQLGMDLLISAPAGTASPRALSSVPGGDRTSTLPREEP